MKWILDIATVLGGVAALVYFWDRLAVLWSRRRHLEVYCENPAWYSKTRHSNTESQIPSIVFSSLAGIFLGIVCGIFGYIGMMLFSYLSIFSSPLEKLAERFGYENVSGGLLNASIFMFFWGTFAGIGMIILQSIGGFAFTGFSLGISMAILGGIAGGISGAAMSK